MDPYSVLVDIGGVWHFGTWLLSFVFACVIVGRYTRRIGWAAALLWGYILAQSIYILEFPKAAFPFYNLAFQKTAGEVLCEALIVPLGVMYLRPRTILALWKWVIPVLLALDMVYLWFGECGFLLAPSFDTAFIALCLPFVPLVFQVLGVITIVLHHGSTALMILGVQFLVWAYFEPKHRLKVAVALPGIALAAYLHSHGPMLDGAERLTVWTRYMNFWASDFRAMILGVGPGSFMWTSLMIDKFQAPMFLQMHSDFLQILFELGFIGWGLSLAVFHRCVKLSRGDIRKVAGLFGLFAFTLTYHPFRWGPSMFVCVLILRGTIQNGPEVYLPGRAFFLKKN